MRSAVLFDVDGVLLDSTPAYRDAWTRWATSRGLELESIRRVAYGRRPIDIIRGAAPELDALAELAVFRRMLADVVRVEAMSGAADLLDALPPGSWAVVTSGERREVVERLGRAKLPCPPVTVCGDDVVAGKPDPSGYRLAAQRLGAEPHSCVVVEDSPVGVAAGKSAGMEVFAVATTHRQPELRLADRVYPTLADAAPDLLARVTGASLP